jgi:LysR family transcriptional regulator, glycine cleavage system transcriptional activator
MKRQLPPLNALRVFEIAAKSESFSQTADTLSVTQSAVSKQIRLLEDNIGNALFERHGGTVTLTPEGENYLAIVSQALDIVEAGSEKYYHPEQKQILTINIMPSLSTLWMFSRVEDFHRTHPKILIRINSSDDNIDWHKNQMDIAVRCKPKHGNSGTDELLFKENLLLVATPKTLKNNNVKTINDLQFCEKIDLKNRPNLWDKFFDSIDTECTKSIQQNNYYSCEHFYMVVQAALESIGIGLVPDFLCRNLIKEGKLINVFDLHTQTEYGYYLITPPHKKDMSKVVKFSQWIKHALKQDI